MWGNWANSNNKVTANSSTDLNPMGAALPVCAGQACEENDAIIRLITSHFWWGNCCSSHENWL